MASVPFSVPRVAVCLCRLRHYVPGVRVTHCLNDQVILIEIPRALPCESLTPSAALDIPPAPTPDPGCVAPAPYFWLCFTRPATLTALYVPALRWRTTPHLGRRRPEL